MSDEKNNYKPIILASLVVMMVVFSGTGIALMCVGPNDNGSNVAVKPLHGESSHVVGVNFYGVGLAGLESINEQFDTFDSGLELPQCGCSFTIAKYENGHTGAVRNFDYHIRDGAIYQMYIEPGDFVKNKMWGFSYDDFQEELTYKDIINNGIPRDLYERLPYTCTDCVSIGTLSNGQQSALYASMLIREPQYVNGEFQWLCTDTCPDAPIRCMARLVPFMLTSQCLTIEDALKYVGAENENYERIYPDVKPMLNLYTPTITSSQVQSVDMFMCIPLMDTSGRYGMLEFIDNHVIWHENKEYSFNFFLQDEYLKNPDGTYRELNATGLGRYNAIMPYLKDVKTMDEHIELMNTILYSYATFGNERTGHVGKDVKGNLIDFRSEYCLVDPWFVCDCYKKLGVDTSQADADYPFCWKYRDTNTGQIVTIDSVEMWEKNIDHLESINDTNFMMADENKEMANKAIKWMCSVNCNTTYEQKCDLKLWITTYRVTIDMNTLEINCWYHEDMTLVDHIDITKLQPF